MDYALVATNFSHKQIECNQMFPEQYFIGSEYIAYTIRFTVDSLDPLYIRSAHAIWTTKACPRVLTRPSKSHIPVPDILIPVQLANCKILPAKNPKLSHTCAAPDTLRQNSPNVSHTIVHPLYDSPDRLFYSSKTRHASAWHWLAAEKEREIHIPLVLSRPRACVYIYTYTREK